MPSSSLHPPGQAQAPVNATSPTLPPASVDMGHRTFAWADALIATSYITQNLLAPRSFCSRRSEPTDLTAWASLLHSPHEPGRPLEWSGASETAYLLPTNPAPLRRSTDEYHPWTVNAEERINGPRVPQSVYVYNTTQRLLAARLRPGGFFRCDCDTLHCIAPTRALPTAPQPSSLSALPADVAYKHNASMSISPKLCMNT